MVVSVNVSNAGIWVRPCYSMGQTLLRANSKFYGRITITLHSKPLSMSLTRLRVASTFSRWTSLGHELGPVSSNKTRLKVFDATEIKYARPAYRRVSHCSLSTISFPQLYTLILYVNQWIKMATIKINQLFGCMSDFKESLRNWAQRFADFYRRVVGVLLSDPSARVSCYSRPMQYRNPCICSRKQGG
jgi:hypothetical protein